MGRFYDRAMRRRARRSGREKGAHIYLPAEELAAAGWGDEWPIYYRVWGSKRGLTIRLYRDPD